VYGLFDLFDHVMPLQQTAGVAVEGDVGYGDVAWWRGIALWFLKQIVDVIDVARANDPRIRAVPLREPAHRVQALGQTHPQGARAEARLIARVAPAQEYGTDVAVKLRYTHQPAAPPTVS
jgi:hypothetical protein